MAYYFNKLRYRARERGHSFSLTIDQFATLWNGKGILNGKTRHSLSFHRIINSQGYHFGNVELRTLSENSRMKYVPYFKNKADGAAAIAETSAKISALIKEGKL